MNFLVPQGIGDSIWAMFKIRALADKLKAKTVDVKVACWNTNILEGRAEQFLNRFVEGGLIDSVEMKKMPKIEGQHGCVLKPGDSSTKEGYYNYIDDGPLPLFDIDYVMIPNAPLERGIRLEEWMPDVAVDWEIFPKHYFFSDDEQEVADQFCTEYGEFIAFYLGPYGGNTIAGHNRDALWRPGWWGRLGNTLIEKYGINIVLFGAEYDRDYWGTKVSMHSRKHQRMWINKIGEWSDVNQTFAILNRCKFMITYQCGLGIVAHYLGKKVGIFWREYGNSINPNEHISFKEEMATAWAYPEHPDLAPYIYGKDDIDSVYSDILKRKW